MVVELDNTELPWLIGEVVEELFAYEGEQFANYTGTISSGDSVLKIRQWMAMEGGGGSSIFQTSIFETSMAADGEAK